MPYVNLSDVQKKFFESSDYLSSLPRLFDDSQIAEINSGFNELSALLMAGESSKEIREWHESSRFLFDLSTIPTILDYVEDLLGPNFYLWASNFFVKEPRTGETVSWHQDAYYWPLTPHNMVTVWLALTDSNTENGAMRVVPGSHRGGLVKHSRNEITDSVLSLELEDSHRWESEAVPIELTAGEISIHHDTIIHGSPANTSDQPRAALTIRYSSTEVKCDLSVNPHFKTYICRGVDTFNHNRSGVIPTAEFARLDLAHISIEEAGSGTEEGYYSDREMG